MYEEFFGLTEKPFSIQPDPSFLYWGRSHRLAYAMLEYGVLNHAGISIVTGEVGCGKTTLVHRLLDQLSEQHAVALLSNVQQGRGDLLSWVLMGFGQPFSGKTHVELFSQLQSFFIGEYAKGRRVVLIIDEAQNLSIDMLEELRLLSNINAGKDQLLQLILVGQPQLKDLLNRPEMLQLAQRVGSDFHLTPLSREEVDAYIDTRLRIAGADRRIFTEHAVEVIAEQSGGVPRVINIIADTALVYAFSSQESVVDVQTVSAVIRDKLDYGVFGLASSAPSPGARGESGPTPFLRREPVAPIRETRGESAARLNLVEDTARLSPTPRRVGRATGLAEERAESPSYLETERVVAASLKRDPSPTEQSPAATSPVARPVLANDYSERRAAPSPAPEPERAPSPPSARREPPVETKPAPAPTPPPMRAARSGVSVIVIGAGGAPEATIASIVGAAAPAVFVAQYPDEGTAASARQAGVAVAEFADRALSPGRARNAGYRQAAKARPGVAYVQFVESGVVLDPGWLDAAQAFMERRPEVVAVEGLSSNSAAAAASSASAGDEIGEIMTTGSTVFVRAEAFEAIGGFRGDLPVNETADLCIRFRRRGGHIWRVDAPMGARGAEPSGPGAWWAQKSRAGFEYAHGASLHGNSPESLYKRERARAIFWGGFLPAFIVTAAVLSAAIARLLSPATAAWQVFAVAFGLGASFYILRIIVVAAGAGGGPRAWARASSSTFSCIPEFFGAWRYYFGGGRARRQTRAVA